MLKKELGSINNLREKKMSFFPSLQVAVSSFLSLECKTIDSAWNSAIVSGVFALSVHLLCDLVFRFGGNSISKDSGFAAHQVVAFFYMTVLFVVGGSQWYYGDLPPTAFSRVVDNNGTSRWLAAITFGQLISWDIPCGLGLVPSMSGDMVMLGHHVIMAFVAFCGMFHIPSCKYIH